MSLSQPVFIAESCMPGRSCLLEKWRWGGLLGGSAFGMEVGGITHSDKSSSSGRGLAPGRLCWYWSRQPNGWASSPVCASLPGRAIPNTVATSIPGLTKGCVQSFSVSNGFSSWASRGHNIINHDVSSSGPAKMRWNNQVQYNFASGSHSFPFCSLFRSFCRV